MCKILLIIIVCLVLVILVCFVIFQDAINEQTILIKLMGANGMRDTFLCHGEPNLEKCFLEETKVGTTKDATSNDSKDN